MDEEQQAAIKEELAKAHADAAVAVYAAIVREAGRIDGDEGARNVLTLARAIRQFAPTGWFAYAPKTRAVWTEGDEELDDDDPSDE